MFVAGGLSIFYFYLVVIVNITLLTAQGYLWFPARLRNFFAYIFCSGIVGLVLGTNSTAGFVKSFLGITMCALCSASLLRYFHFNAEELFRVYARFAFYSAVFAILYWPFQPSHFGRMAGLFLEPSALVIVCLPAVYYYADQWQRKRRYGLRLIVLFFAYLMTFSSLGYLGLLFGGLLFGKRYRIGRVAVPVVLFLAASLIYQQSSYFQVRLNDTVGGIVSNDVGNINESSFGIVANLFIVQKQFVDHPLLGGGLGSHVVTHAKYIDQIPGAAYLPSTLHSLGQWDASSLLLRIVSEFGLVGLVYASWFIWWFYPRGANAEVESISMALLCYIFMKMIRSGEYFGGEEFFFLSIYAIIGVKTRFRARRPTTTSVNSASTPGPLLATPQPES